MVSFSEPINDSRPTTVSDKFVTRAIIALFCKTRKQNTHVIFKIYHLDNVIMPSQWQIVEKIDYQNGEIT